MAAGAAFFLIAAAFVTAIVSGIFGMAGGLMLKGAIALVLPVSATFVTHGLLQLVANGYRAILHRRFLAWRIVGFYAVGSIAIGAALALTPLEPSKPLLFLLMGLVPFLLWIPRGWLNLDAAHPAQAVVCGLSVTGLNLTAGVAGPLLDTFFVRTELSRHQIVATKAATQVFSHLAKIIVYGAPLLAMKGATGLPPWWVFAFAVPLSMLGTTVGGLILARIDDVAFKRWARWVVTAIGVLYLFWAAQLFMGVAPVGAS